jgi:hypothetical protein
MRTITIQKVWATAGLAFILWFGCFYLDFSTFWLKISASVVLLSLLAYALGGFPKGFLRMSPKDVLLGVLLAAVLYCLFWLGKSISLMLFPFAEGQIDAIYDKGEGYSRAAIFFALFFITAPFEEIYWRGFLQRHFCEKYGDRRGWLLAVAVYSLVHVWSFNFMLIGSAAVAGAFWGWCYMRLGRFAPVLVSHAVWSAFTFSIMPIP